VGAYDIDPIHVGELSRLETSDSILSTVLGTVDDGIRLKFSQGLALVRNETKVSTGDNVIPCKFEELYDLM
jgi:hypothetical protein